MISLLLALTLSAGDVPDVRWPAFLGQGAPNVDPAQVPLEWSPESVAWQLQTPGYGQSSPVVWGDTAYLTAVEGPNKETNVLFAVDLAAGKLAWRHDAETSMTHKNDVYVSRAAPTPVADADGVYAFFESGDLVAADHAGKVRWTRSLSEDYGKYAGRFMLGGSPTQTDAAVIVLADDEAGGYLIALDKDSGANLWKTDRAGRTAWSSPVVVPFAGKQVVLVSAAGSIDGYDAATGAQYFHDTSVGGNTVATPVTFGDGRFLVGAAPGRRGENTEEAAKSNGAYRLVADDGAIGVKRDWTAQKASPSFGSPIVHDGLAYWVNRVGVVTCLDADTGEQKFEQRLPESIWATPLGVGDRVYFFGKDGTTTVLDADGRFDVLATNRLWTAEEKDDEGGRGGGNFGGRTQYGVAVAGDRLLVRTGDVLYCVRP